MKVFSDTTRKNIISVLVGPLTVIPAMLAIGLAVQILSPEESSTTDWKQVFSFFSVMGLYIAYPLTVLFALPLIIVLQKINAFTLKNVILTALVIAAVLSLASSSQPLAFVYFGFFTVSVALVCWVVHKWA